MKYIFLFITTILFGCSHIEHDSVIFTITNDESQTYEESLITLKILQIDSNERVLDYNQPLKFDVTRFIGQNLTCRITRRYKINFHSYRTTIRTINLYIPDDQNIYYIKTSEFPCLTN